VEPPAQTENHGAEDDLTLVHATKRGHASAFEKLVRKYDRKLLRIAQSVTHNREEAEDAVQEAFFKAYQRLDQFQESAKFSTWLIRIVLNEALTKLRRQRTAQEESLDRDFQSDTDVPPLEAPDWSPNPLNEDAFLLPLRPPYHDCQFFKGDLHGPRVDQTADDGQLLPYVSYERVATNSPDIDKMQHEQPSSPHDRRL